MTEPRRPSSASDLTPPTPHAGAYRPGEDEGWADFVARAFHTEYERIAPQFGYRTRPESAVTWDNVPETNKRLMRSVIAALVQHGVIELGEAASGNAPSQIKPSKTSKGSSEAGESA